MLIICWNFVRTSFKQGFFSKPQITCRYYLFVFFSVHFLLISILFCYTITFYFMIYLCTLNLKTSFKQIRRAAKQMFFRNLCKLESYCDRLFVIHQAFYFLIAALSWTLTWWFFTFVTVVSTQFCQGFTPLYKPQYSLLKHDFCWETDRRFLEIDLRTESQGTSHNHAEQYFPWFFVHLSFLFFTR